MSHHKEKDKLIFEDIFPSEQEPQPEDFNSSLDIPDIKVDVNISFETPKSEGDKEDFDKDLQYVRNKLLNSIGQADQILTSLLKKIIVDDTTSMLPEQQPKGYYKYYEASTQLLKSICDSSKELLNLHSTNIKTKKEMGWIKQDDEKEKIDEKTGEVIKPTTNTGTMSDIVNKFKDMKKDSENANKNNDSE